MKKLATVLISLIAASAMFAQGGAGRRNRTPPTPEQMVERRIQMLTTLLTLDSAQQAQAKTIFTDEMTASQGLRDKEKTAHEALQTAVKSSASDAQIDQLAAAIGLLDGQQAGIHAKAQSKFRAILNSAQKEKLDTVDEHRGFGPGPGGPGGFGRGPRF